MKYQIFGTVKEVTIDTTLKVSEIKIIPIQEYAVKAVDDSSKKVALLRPLDDDGDALQVIYTNSLSVTGTGIKELVSIIKPESKVGFEVEDNGRKTKAHIKFTGTTAKALKFIGVLLT